MPYYTAGFVDWSMTYPDYAAARNAAGMRMDAQGPCYDLIVQMMQTVELDRFQRDRRIAASRVEGIEKQRRQVLRDIENVRGLIAAAGEFRAMTARVMSDLARRSPARKEAA